MTAPRGKVSASLASRGVQDPWANEAEAAFYSGLGLEAFRSKVKGWEKAGFPQIDPRNGKRPVSAILAFWGLPQNHYALPAAAVTESDQDDGEETWNGSEQSQRKAS